MKRLTKYYVSELKSSVLGTVWHRLTKYYLTESEARRHLSRLSHHYDNLFIRQIMPNYSRKTLS